MWFINKMFADMIKAAREARAKRLKEEKAEKEAGNEQ